jgi:hypothetical protein
MRIVTAGIALILGIAVVHSTARATIVVNPAMPIDRELVVQLIQAGEATGQVRLLFLATLPRGSPSRTHSIKSGPRRGST